MALHATNGVLKRGFCGGSESGIAGRQRGKRRSVSVSLSGVERKRACACNARRHAGCHPTSLRASTCTFICLRLVLLLVAALCSSIHRVLMVAIQRGAFRRQGITNGRILWSFCRAKSFKADPHVFVPCSIRCWHVQGEREARTLPAVHGALWPEAMGRVCRQYLLTTLSAYRESCFLGW
ncbi:unnamed protein product [Phaeothamnion confervicola]